MHTLSTLLGAGRAGMWRWNCCGQTIIALACLAATAWANASPATPELKNSVLAFGDLSSGFDKTVTGAPAVGATPGIVHLGSLNGAESHFAAASGESLTLRASVASSGESNQPQTISSFNWTTESTGGTIGDPLTVTLTFQIDGHLAAGFASAFGTGNILLPFDYSLQARAASSLRLDVYDLDSVHYEGGSPDARVQFNSGVSVESHLGSSSASYPSGFANSSVSHSVNLQVYDPINGAWAWAGNDSASNNFPGASPIKEVLDIDTGSFSVSFNTFVGNRINLIGSLETNIYCLRDAPAGTAPACAGLSDFANTFDGEITSNLADVSFTNYAPGVFAAAVPEPAAWAMMLGGLPGVIVWIRKRRNGSSASAIATG